MYNEEGNNKAINKSSIGMRFAAVILTCIITMMETR
jgi:hypothetical protein